MHEAMHTLLAFLGFFLWPISGIACIYAFGAMIIQGHWQWFLFAALFFALLNIFIWALSLWLEA